MAGAILLVGLWVRGRQLLRFWPLLLLLPVAIHLAVPGALGGIYNAFSPQEGFASDLATRSGEQGSGRLADLDPGLRAWSESPLYGNGVGTPDHWRGRRRRDRAGSPGSGHLLRQRVAGHARLARRPGAPRNRVDRVRQPRDAREFARRTRGPRSDLAAACAASIGSFGVSMLVFDSGAFVQATILFFMITALGLLARRLGPRPTDA